MRLPDEAQELMKVDLEGSVIETYGQPMNNLEGPQLSPDGSRIVAEYEPEGESVNNIGIFDVNRSVWTRLTTDEIDQGHPRWSADGRRIYFRDGSDIATIRSDGVGGKSTLFAGRNPDPSPDGAWLLYQKGQDMMGVRLDEDGLRSGEAQPQPSTALGMEFRGAISPDGTLIAYASNESGKVEIYLTEFPVSKSRWQVSVNGGFSPKWRGDGGAIFYSLNNALYQVDVEAVGEGPRLGNPTTLFSGESFNGRTANGYFPADNGTSFLVVRNTGDPGIEDQKLILVQNWRTELDIVR